MKAKAWGTIVGVAERLGPGGMHSTTLEEAIFECANAALTDAGVVADDLDGVVTASSDQLDGRAISLMVTSGSVAGAGRDVINVSSSGEHALAVAATRAAAGTHHLQLVVSWGRPSEADPRELDRIACEPFYTRAIGLDARSAQAIAASRYVASHGLHEAEAAAFVAAATRRAVRSGRAVGEETSAERVGESPWATWPLREGHFTPLADGVVAMVLANDEAVARFRGPIARIAGLAWTSGSYWLSERGYDAGAASARAVQRALALADRSPRDCGCWEWHFTSPYQAFATVEAVGLIDPGEAPAWLATEPTGHNPSGGAYVGDTLFSTGLSRVAEAARQVMGRAGDAQVAGVRLAVAHATSGFADQSASAFVLES